MNCREIEELLTPYLLGDLDAAQAAEVRRHVESCEACRRDMAELGRTLDLLKSAMTAGMAAAPVRLDPARRQKALATQRFSLFPIRHGKKIADTGKASVLAPYRQFLAWRNVMGVAAALILLLGIATAWFMPYRKYSLGGAPSMEVACMESSESSVLDQIVDKLEEPGIDNQKRMSHELARATEVEAPLFQIEPHSGVADVVSKRSRSAEAPSRSHAGLESKPAPPASESSRESLGEIAQDLSKDEDLADHAGRVVSRQVFGYQRVETESKREDVKLGVEVAGKAFQPSAGEGEADKERAKADQWKEEAAGAVLADAATLAAATPAASPAAALPPPAKSERRLRETGEKSKRVDLAYNALAKARPEVVEAVAPLETPPEIEMPAGLIQERGGVIAGSEATGAGTGSGGPVESGSDASRGFDLVQGAASPLTFKGLYASRSAGGRRLARDKSGGLPESQVLDQEATGIKAVVEEPKPAKPVFKRTDINPWIGAETNNLSTFSIDVDTASYTLSRNYMLKGSLPPPEAVRVEEFVNFFDYAYPAPAGSTFGVYVDCARSPFHTGVNLLRIGVKGRHLGREQRQLSVLTLLVDTSGSMNTPDRLGLVKRSLRLLLARLNAADRVAIVQFSSHARLLLEHTPVAQQAKILAAIDGLQCSGYTHLEGGLHIGYQTAAKGFRSGAANRVLLMSDGVANLGTDAAAEILLKAESFRKQGIYCSVFGFGQGTYDDTMLLTLADKGNGSYHFIDSVAEAQRVLVDDLAATLNTIASDVKIQVEFNARRVKQYRQLGYEKRKLQAEDFRNDAVDAGEVGSGQSATALYEIELQSDSREPMGVVRVRYRNLETGHIEEVAKAIAADRFIPRFEQADLRFRLAAVAAEFAEILRASPYAEGDTHEDVAKVLRPVALELRLDQRVQELLRLVHAAPGLPQAQE